MIVGIALLVWSADRFVDGAAAIARNWHIPPMVIGLTIVSLGTSLPEMLVATIAALDGSRNLGIGNVLGSNIANIGLVLGITAMIVPLTIKSITLRREMPILLLITFLAFALMADGTLSFMDGLVLLAGLVLMLVWMVRTALHDKHDPLLQEMTETVPESMAMKKAAMWFVVGLLLLMISSRMVVWGAVEIAQFLGVSDLVIGLTIVAIGTSLPELVASIASAVKNEADLAIGNVIGSNMFNLLAVLMMPALIEPGVFSSQALLRDFPIMLLFTVALVILTMGSKSHSIGRFKGSLLVSSFAAYLYLLYLQA